MKAVFITVDVMKLAQASFGVRKDAEHSFQLCAGSTDLVHANLSVYRISKTVFTILVVWNSILVEGKA